METEIRHKQTGLTFSEAKAKAMELNDRVARLDPANPEFLKAYKELCNFNFKLPREFKVAIYPNRA
jgi:hypothetical protein